MTPDTDWMLWALALGLWAWFAVFLSTFVGRVIRWGQREPE